jgi:hypothetical protein
VTGIETLYTEFDFESNDFFQYAFWSTDFFDFFENYIGNSYVEDTIYCAILPKDSRNDEEGRGWPGGLNAFGGTAFPLAYWRVDPDEDSYLEGHELGHTFNLMDKTGDTDIDIKGYDCRYSYSRNVTLGCKSKDVDQLMDDGSHSRWMHPSEYLWIQKSIGASRNPEQLIRRMNDVVSYCNEKGLPVRLAFFYVS